MKGAKSATFNLFTTIWKQTKKPLSVSMYWTNYLFSTDKDEDSQANFNDSTESAGLPVLEGSKEVKLSANECEQDDTAGEPFQSGVQCADEQSSQPEQEPESEEPSQGTEKPCSATV